MTTRRRALPPGWYPADEASVAALVDEWSRNPPPSGALAAVAPHAGWAFSGRLAAQAALSLAPADTVAVIGGHLPAGYPVLAGGEAFFETPLGAFSADAELREALGAALSLEEDRASDNTVEVQLPILRARFPGARLLWLRAPAGEVALELGQALYAAARSLNRRLAIVGSTDLTHYGPDYGFTPAGRGEQAERWVRETSDKGFIDALLAMDGKAVLARGDAGAACSSGAAAAAIAYAKAAGAKEAKLLGYATSLDVRKGESFVGYCSVAYY
ncbi:MAG: AmmeMemoRadiSam system protein B [Spirochaetaceae bacterium]|nr:AmmeMemoRadiSam system protein B [Spirochaetaceae bacterium]